MRLRQITVTLILTLASASVACDHDQIDQTRADMYVMAQAVALRHTQDGVCPPSIADLVDATVLQPTALHTDDWGSEIRLSCAPPIYRATSAGPDRTFGTADDITATQTLEAKTSKSSNRSWKGSED